MLAKVGHFFETKLIVLNGKADFFLSPANINKRFQIFPRFLTFFMYVFSCFMVLETISFYIEYYVFFFAFAASFRN